MASVLPAQELLSVTAEICGWIEGNADYPLKCQPSQKCARDVDNSIIGCCWNPKGGSCSLHTTCFDRRAVTGVVEISSAMLCVASAAPYCKTDIFAGDPDVQGYSLFICDSDTKADTIYRYTTVKSQTDNAMTLDPIITTSIPSPTPHQQPSQTTISGSSTRSSIPLTHSSLYVSNETKSRSTSATTSINIPLTSSSPSHSLTNAPAAIAGMAIGSAAALTILGAFSYLAYRYVKKRRTQRLKLKAAENKRRPGDDRHEVGVQVSR